MTGGKRTAHSGRSVSSHIHGHTPVQGRPNPHPRLQPTNTHKLHSARLLHMSNEPHSDGDTQRPQGEGGDDPFAPPPANPLLAGKFGAAPSFAAVVSAATTPRTATATTNTKPPLTSTPFSTLNQQQQQQEQEHAHSRASLGHITSSGFDSGISDNTPSSATSNNNNNNSSGTANQNHHSSPSPHRSKNAQSPTSACDVDDAAPGIGQQENELELEDSESSDVEIYLNARGFKHDSATHNGMHALVHNAGPGSDTSASLNAYAHDDDNVYSGYNRQAMPSASSADVMTNAFSGLRIGNSNSNSNNTNNATTATGNSEAIAPKSLSPLPPSSISPPSTFLLPQQARGTQSTSPQLPQAPVQGTVPLPRVEVEEYDHARQLQNLQYQHDQDFLHNINRSGGYHHTSHEQCSTNPVLQGGPIDLTGLAIGAGAGGLQAQASDHNSRQHQQQTISLGIPSSQSHPMFSSSSPMDAGGSSGSALDFPTSVSESGMAGGVQKTANVYINGLPPHFPEDQLFALAAPFGSVRSVRTFTRHVRDSESGYGFVLFEDIDSAERCIHNLRKYRNLHPTYSKQIHKIPGTTYAQSIMPAPTSPWGQEGYESGSSSAGGSTADLSAEASFKAKMESLQDPTSTNLYMEGLPLSIDEPTLSALVSPHRIISSRFFQTRLSNPPRIIAFVRLETRAGAEEVIERLHGRMVRGWNDTGSRISVRFADTSEQRELRRTERVAQEGDGSPARLTIAQAALLNLRGQDLRPSGQSTGPVIHAHSAVSSRVPSGSLSRSGLTTSLSAPDFASNAHAAAGQDSLNVDYNLAPSRLPNSQRSRSPYHAQQGLGYQQEPFPSHAQLGHTPPPPSMDPAMAAILNSLNNNGAPYQGAASGYTPEDLGYGVHGQSLGMGQQQQQLHGLGHGHGHGHGAHHLPTSQSVDSSLHQYARAAPAYTRSGYTATEEYIMRAHAESAALAQAQAQIDRRRPAPLDFSRRRSEEESGLANIAVGVRGYRAQASLGRVGQGVMSPAMTTASLGSVSSPMVGSQLGGEDFQTSSASLGRNDLRQQYRSLSGAGLMDSNSEGEYGRQNAAPQMHNSNLHPPHVNARLSRDPSTTSGPLYQHSPSLTSPAMEQQQQELSPSLNDAIGNYQHAAAHMRSTTLPQHRSSSMRDSQQQQGHARGHYQHSSMSMPAQNLRTPQHASVAQMGGIGGIEGVHGGSSTIYENEAQEQVGARHQQQQQQASSSRNDGNTGSNQGAQDVIGTIAPGGANAKAHYANSGNVYADMESASSSTPSLISPTLTCGTQTPSTLSPATPFFGSFNSQSEGFEKASNGSAGLEHQHQPQRKASSSTLNSSSLNPTSLRNQ